MLCSFGRQIFCRDEAKSTGILCVFRAFLTIYRQKYAAKTILGSDISWLKESIMAENYKEFLAKRDMTWNYAPKSIFEGPFTGNGETGISLYFKDENTLYMNLGNTDIYDNRLPTEEMTYKERENLFLSPRLSLGGFGFRIKNGSVKNEMRLSLYDAMISGKLSDGEKEASFEAFTAENENAVIFSWVETGIELEPAFMPSEASSPRQKMMIAIGHDNRRSFHYDPPKAPVTKSANGAVAYIQPKFSGGNYSVTYKLFENGNRKTLICLIGKDSEPELAAPDRIYSAMEQVRKAHDTFWHGFYNSSLLEIDDEEIDRFYWMQLYKCACATRSGKRIFDTSGPWLDNFTAWPAAWWNLNIELHYSLLYPSNHLEIAASLPETIRNHIEELRANVPKEYRNGRYITVGRNTTSTLSTPCGIPGKEEKEIELELGNILWALHNCYIHFSSAADDEALSGEFFDNLKNAADYIVNFLVKEADGKYHLLPTSSPEYPGISKDCNYTLSLLRWALKTLIELDERYGINDGGTPARKEYYGDLAYYAYNEAQGFMIGADYPLAMSHRHYSHLLMIYPLHLLDEADPSDREKIIRSIEHWHSMPEALLGYSQTGAASMFALLGDGNRAYKHLKNLFKGFICPNTMYNEDNNPVLETPPAAARSVLDMLMYSHGNEIRIFDAVPDKWQNVRYENLLSESGCEVSARRENGKTVYAKIKAKKARCIRLKISFDSAPEASKSYETDGNYYYFNLDGGEEIIFRSN